MNLAARVLVRPFGLHVVLSVCLALTHRSPGDEPASAEFDYFRVYRQ